MVHDTWPPSSYPEAARTLEELAPYATIDAVYETNGRAMPPLPAPGETAQIGKKEDAEKERWDLLPYDALGDVVRVLTHGAKKYGPENWRDVPFWKSRYFSAALRHVTAYWRGQERDEETGLPHLSHAICCLLFLASKEKER